MRLRRLRSWAAAAAVLPTALGLTALAATAAHAETSPAGANDWNCKPSFLHPRPVVLVHGTFENMAFNWQTLSPQLKKAGYCVFALNYGGAQDAPIQGTADIPTSAGQLSAFVDRVLTATKASKVDMVGHSQGGMMPRYYIKNLGGASKVNKLVGIVPSNHGTTASGLAALGSLLGITQAVVKAAPSAGQQIVGSSFLADLNAGGDTVAGPTYIVLATKYDEVVTPYTSAFLNGANAQNVLLQDKCASDTNAHVGINFDPVMVKFVLNSLDIWGPYWPINCSNPLG
ncbi:esterase/lipase family protein [Actinomadura parmotrematis]|uniref:Alpha/beta fold hydrolase n=1 Tax=Actinomadura parmotrematis TaxID=2864039 RepID=A0ABS7FYB3_9ACTN|nr:alpha/beta fold hydrolase [Actinomadura parmotrematis]MBW8485421.1 alpha/beta fold hydrolase [Actinomadura parmotrematis]